MIKKTKKQYLLQNQRKTKSPSLPPHKTFWSSWNQIGQQEGKNNAKPKSKNETNFELVNYNKTVKSIKSMLMMIINLDQMTQLEDSEF